MYGINSVYVKGFLVLLVFLFFIIGVTGHSKSARRIQLSFLFIVLFFFAAFRGSSVGGDLANYLPHFKEVCSVRGITGLFNLSSNFEPGYTLIVWLISRLSHSDFAFLAVTSLISLIGPFRLINKYSLWPCFSILIYFMLGFYTNIFNNVRQSIAISIIFLSIPYLLSNKPIKFFTLVALAVSVHTSAFIFAFAYFLRFLPISFKSFSLYLVVGWALSSVAGFFIVQYFGALLLSKYEEIMGEGQGRNLLILYIVITFVSLFTYQIVKKNLKEQEATSLFLQFMAMTTVIQMFAIYFSSIVRLSFYFYIPIIILLPNLINGMKGLNIKFLAGFVVLLVLFYYMCVVVYAYIPEIDSNVQAVIPYSFIFS